MILSSIQRACLKSTYQKKAQLSLHDTCSQAEVPDSGIVSWVRFYLLCRRKLKLEDLAKMRQKSQPKSKYKFYFFTNLQYALFKCCRSCKLPLLWFVIQVVPHGLYDKSCFCFFCFFLFWYSYISTARIITVLENMENNLIKSSIMEQSVWKE